MMESLAPISADTRPLPGWEKAFILFGLLILTGALNAFLYDLTGESDGSSDVNPFNLILLLTVYLAASWLIVQRNLDKAMRLVTSNLLVFLVFILPVVS